MLRHCRFGENNLRSVQNAMIEQMQKQRHLLNLSVVQNGKQQEFHIKCSCTHECIQSMLARLRCEFYKQTEN